MKLTSRKALVAAATALALTTSGMSAPAFAEETTPPSTTVASTTPTPTPEPEKKDDFFSGLSSNNKDGEDKGSSTDKKSVDDWKAWIGLFTAIVGALSAGFAFVQKYLK